MNFTCRFCHQQFAWEDGAYPYIQSKVLMHLSACLEARELRPEQKAVAAATAADELFNHHRISYRS